MASQDRSYKYIGSLTEGPSLTSGCGMACCPWTAYACKERTALRRVWRCHTLCIPISISLLSLVCHKNNYRQAGDRTPATRIILHNYTLLGGISSVRSEHILPKTVETFGLKCKRRSKQMFWLFTWPPAKMTGEPEGLGLYGMVTPFGGDYDKHKSESVMQKTNSITHFQKSWVTLY